MEKSDWSMAAVHILVVLRCASTVDLEQCVTTTGVPTMQLLCATSWDTQDKVRFTCISYTCMHSNSLNLTAVSLQYRHTLDIAN